MYYEPWYDYYLMLETRTKSFDDTFQLLQFIWFIVFEWIDSFGFMPYLYNLLSGVPLYRSKKPIGLSLYKVTCKTFYAPALPLQATMYELRSRCGNPRGVSGFSVITLYSTLVYKHKSNFTQWSVSQVFFFTLLSRSFWWRPTLLASGLRHSTFISRAFCLVSDNGWCSSLGGIGTSTVGRYRI